MWTDARLVGAHDKRTSRVVPGIRRLSLAMVVCLIAIVATDRSHATAAQTTICGTINESQTWGPSGSPYIVTCDTTVASGVTLTISSNTIVKFMGRSSGL